MKMKKQEKKKGRWFRCPKCMEVRGPYPEEKDVVFCPHCRMIMAEVDEQRAKKKALFD